MVDPSASSAGVLYVVATPIGNLGDLSPRARQVLSEVAVIAAEDTRHTGQMLQTLGIDTALMSLHEHNESVRAGELIERVASGQSVALVCDAGTPLISDPGFDVVTQARRRGLRIVAIPGPCAAVAALSIAGLPTDRFAFEGFLPAKAGARRTRLQSLAAETRTLVFYEGPHRLAETLADMREALGAQRDASISRELTKHFETTYRATLAELALLAERDGDMARGEIVIVVAGAPVSAAPVALQSEQVLRVLLQELSPSHAAKTAAQLTGERRADLYSIALRLSGKAGGASSSEE